MKINLIDFFEETVAKHPAKTAVVDQDRALTFEELKEKAKFLAGILAEKSGQVNRPIAVFLPKSVNAVLADLAITYTNNIFMNLDIKMPFERINNILDTIKPALIITNREQGQRLQGVDKDYLKIINIDELSFSEIDIRSPSPARIKMVDTDPFCIINTSGSTGTPKGVVLNHRSFIDYTVWAVETFNFNGEETLGVLSPLVFDHYVYEICLMMTKGSTLILIPPSLSSFPIKILEILKRHQVNYIFWVPTIMVNIANMDLLSKIELPELKMVWFAGEVFPTKQFNYWRRQLPQATFVNLYGPTEITVDCTFYVVERHIADQEPIPIGRARRNCDVLVLNDQNQPITKGEEGELCVRGSSLAMGYYNNPDKTVMAFVQNPLNNSYPELVYRTGDIVTENDHGELVFKGRRDTMIKHLGYRIELSEIEHVIINHLSLVKNGCAVYQPQRQQIVFFYEGPRGMSAGDFRKAIGRSLPKYMVPSLYCHVKQLPRTSSGKIDRLSLNQKSAEL